MGFFLLGGELGLMRLSLAVSDLISRICVQLRRLTGELDRNDNSGSLVDYNKSPVCEFTSARVANCGGN